MQITDPIADLLTRIRNAGTAKHETVDVPASKMKKSIAEILMNVGYVKNFQIIDDGTQGIIRITLVQTKNPKDGQVIITFTERPIEVKKWAIVDSKGTTVEVAIFDPRLGVNLDPKLFKFENKKIENNSNRSAN